MDKIFNFYFDCTAFDMQGDGLAPTLVSYDSSLTYSPHSSYYNHAVVGPSVHTDDDRKDSFRGELNYHDEEVAAATEVV